jgi:glycosyltransferase involved in cell wall biosynthesis
VKPLKVLFVIDSLGTGGAEYDLAERLPRFAAFGIAPAVVALRARTEGVQKALQQQGFDIRILRERGLLRRIIALRRIIRAEQPDLVRTVLFNADVTGRFAAVGMRTPVLSCLVNTDYVTVRLADRNLNRLRFALARRLDGWTARHLTAHVHANSEAVKAAAIRDLKLAPDKITVILHARDADRLGQPTPERRERARARLGLRDDQYVLVNIGRQDYQKGQRYLLEALASVVRDHPNIVLLVAGRAGDVSADLLHLVHEMNLERHVLLLGHRDDVPDVLAASDLFVFPSLYEGLPGAVIEAMALGLPIVASDIEPVRELVEDGRNALLVSAGAPDELAAAIERMLADPHVACCFGRRGRFIFEERFTLGASVAREVELYYNVVASGSGRTASGSRGDRAAVPPLADSLIRSPGDKT